MPFYIATVHASMFNKNKVGNASMLDIQSHAAGESRVEAAKSDHNTNTRPRPRNNKMLRTKTLG